jgi:hypothetical protein
MTEEEVAAAKLIADGLALEAELHDKGAAREMLLADEPSRAILRLFTAATQASDRPVIISDVIESERFNCYPDAVKAFSEKSEEYKTLLRAAFPGRIRDAHAQSPLKAATEVERPQRPKIIQISRVEAKNLQSYLAAKARAEKEGAVLQIKAD